MLKNSSRFTPSQWAIPLSGAVFLIECMVLRRWIPPSIWLPQIVAFFIVLIGTVWGVGNLLFQRYRNIFISTFKINYLLDGKQNAVRIYWGVLSVHFLLFVGMVVEIFFWNPGEGSEPLTIRFWPGFILVALASTVIILCRKPSDVDVDVDAQGSVSPFQQSHRDIITFLKSAAIGLVVFPLLFRFKYSGVELPVMGWGIGVSLLILVFVVRKPWFTATSLRCLYLILGGILFPRFMLNSMGYLIGAGSVLQDLVLMVGLFLLGGASVSGAKIVNLQAVTNTWGGKLSAMSGVAFAFSVACLIPNRSLIFWAVNTLSWCTLVLYAQAWKDRKEAKSGFLLLVVGLSFLECLGAYSSIGTIFESGLRSQDGVFLKGGYEYELIQNQSSKDLQLRRDRLTVLESTSAFAERKRLAALGMFVAPNAKKVLWVGGAHPIAIRSLLNLEEVELTLLDFEGIYPKIVSSFPSLRKNAKLTRVEMHPLIFFSRNFVKDDGKVSSWRGATSLSFQSPNQSFDLIIVGDLSPSDEIAQTLYSKEWITLALRSLSGSGRLVQAIRPAQFSEEMVKHWTDAWALSIQETKKIGFDFWRTDLLPEAMRYVYVSRPEGESGNAPWDQDEESKQNRAKQQGLDDLFFTNATIGPVLWVGSGEKSVRWFGRKMNSKPEPVEIRQSDLWKRSWFWRRKSFRKMPLQSGADLLADLDESEVPLSVGGLKWTLALEQFRQADPQWRINYSKANLLLGRALDSTPYVALFAQ